MDLGNQLNLPFCYDPGGIQQKGISTGSEVKVDQISDGLESLYPTMKIKGPWEWLNLSICH